MQYHLFIVFIIIYLLLPIVFIFGNGKLYEKSHLKFLYPLAKRRVYAHNNACNKIFDDLWQEK